MLSPFLRGLRNVITPEMDHEVIESPSFLWTTRILDLISTLLVGIIFCVHLYTTLCTNDASASKSKIKIVSEGLRTWNKVLSVFTILFLLSQFILMVSLSLDMWELLPTSLDCTTFVLFIVSVYHLSKSFFYSVFITRLQVAFNASSLKYSSVTIALLYLFVFIYTVFCVIVGTPSIIYGKWIMDPVTWCHIHTLDSMKSTISIIVWITSDVAISVILCWFFMRPIKKVLQLTEGSPSQRFLALYIKYGLLTYISIILNLVSLLFYLFDHLTILIETTAAINCACIVLMYARYQPIFDTCCGCIVGCFVKKKKGRLESDRDPTDVSDHAELNALKSDHDANEDESDNL